MVVERPTESFTMGACGGRSMASTGDDESRSADLDAEIDALARRVERAIAAHRSAQDDLNLEPLPLSPLDRARSVLSQPSAGGTSATDDADPPATRDDNP